MNNPGGGGGGAIIAKYCDLRGRIKENAEALHHVLHSSSREQSHIARRVHYNTRDHASSAVNHVIHSACTLTIKKSRIVNFLVSSKAAFSLSDLYLKRLLDHNTSKLQSGDRTSYGR